MQLSPFCSWSCQSSVWHLPYVFRRKFTGFLSSCSLLYPCERVMLLLSAEASFKPDGSFFWEFASKYLPQGLIFGLPSLAHKGCGYPIFLQNFLLALLAYMESAATHLTLTFISFCCIRRKTFLVILCISEKHRTRYGSHPFDWGVFQEAWSYGA